MCIRDSTNVRRIQRYLATNRKYENGQKADFKGPEITSEQPLSSLFSLKSLVIPKLVKVFALRWLYLGC
jgi:hypothetical protein